MKDTDLYTALLGLGNGWRVTDVKLDVANKRVDVRVEAVRDREWGCPVCQKSAAFYDLAEEQTWRHLDTCDCRTYVHARLPRTRCSQHNVRQVAAPWAGPRSQFTILMESRAIDTLK